MDLKEAKMVKVNKPMHGGQTVVFQVTVTLTEYRKLMFRAHDLGLPTHTYAAHIITDALDIEGVKDKDKGGKT